MGAPAIFQVNVHVTRSRSELQPGCNQSVNDDVAAVLSFIESLLAVLLSDHLHYYMGEQLQNM